MGKGREASVRGMGSGSIGAGAHADEVGASHLVDRYLHQAGEGADPSLCARVQRRCHPYRPPRVARPATTTVRDSSVVVIFTKKYGIYIS